MPTAMKLRKRGGTKEGIQPDSKNGDSSPPGKKGKNNTRKNTVERKTAGKRKGSPEKNPGSSKRNGGSKNSPSKNKDKAPPTTEPEKAADSDSITSPSGKNKGKILSQEPVKQEKDEPKNTDKNENERDGEGTTPEQPDVEGLEEGVLSFRKKTPQKAFDEKLEELKQYKAKHGHTNVPKNKEYKSLGRWVNNQRQFHRKREQGESTSLTDERIKSLESLGFSWSMNKPVSEHRAKHLQECWEQKLKELKEYKNIHGDVNIPVNGKYKELGKWVMNQRFYYKSRLEGRKNSLTQERIEDLENLGFTWTIKGRREGDKFLNNEEKWERNIKELTKFKEKWGHINVVKSGEYSELGQFCGNMRYNYRRRLKGETNSLTDDRIKTLDDLGFDWKVQCKGDASKLDISLKTKGGTHVIEKDKEIILPDGSATYHATREKSQKRLVLLENGSHVLEVTTKTYTTKIEKGVLPPEDDLDADKDPVVCFDTVSPPTLPGVRNVSKSENEVTYPDGSTVLRTQEETMEKRILELDDDSELLETTTKICITKIERIRLPEESPVDADNRLSTST